MTEKSLRAVGRLLEKAFDRVEKRYFGDWNEAKDEGLAVLGTIEALVGLLRPVRAPSGLDDGGNTCAEEELIEVDLVEQISAQLGILRTKVLVLKSCQQKIEECVEKCMDDYRRLCLPEFDDGGLIAGSLRSAIEDLLRKVNWIDDMLANSYMAVKWHFDFLAWRDVESIRQLSQLLESSSNSAQIRKYCLEAAVVFSVILPKERSND